MQKQHYGTRKDCEFGAAAEMTQLKAKEHSK